jgi:hypothetical protein
MAGLDHLDRARQEGGEEEKDVAHLGLALPASRKYLTAETSTRRER